MSQYNHRGEQVIDGDPHVGTYRGIANQEHECMGCCATIEPGDEFEEDFVMFCMACCAELDADDEI